MARRVLISQREFARRIGVSHVAVGYAVKSGRITTVNGKIDPKLARSQWLDNTDQSKPRNRITGKPKHRRKPDQPSEPMDLDRSAGAGSGYAKAHAMREFYVAQRAKLEFEHRKGMLVAADEVRKTCVDEARRARDQVLAMPERVSGKLAAATDPLEVERILEEEIERIFEEISSADRD